MQAGILPLPEAGPVETGSTLVTHSERFEVFGHPVDCWELRDGSRVMTAEGVHGLMVAIAEAFSVQQATGAEPMEPNLSRMASWLKGEGQC